MWQAWSQVGSRLAVASMAKISRPRSPAGRTTGTAATFFRKASTSVWLDVLGSFSSPAMAAHSPYLQGSVAVP
jgi:hypothetical protein